VKLHVGPAVLRRRIRALPRDSAVSLLAWLYPELDARRIKVMLDHANELRVNGSALLMPESWDDLLSDRQ
jgi:hypothetical protein